MRLNRTVAHTPPQTRASGSPTCLLTRLLLPECWRAMTALVDNMHPSDTSDESTPADRNDAVEPNGRIAYSQTLLRARSGRTGVRFESSSAHVEKPRKRGASCSRAVSANCRKVMVPIRDNGARTSAPSGGSELSTPGALRPAPAGVRASWRSAIVERGGSSRLEHPRSRGCARRCAAARRAPPPRPDLVRGDVGGRERLHGRARRPRVPQRWRCGGRRRHRGSYGACSVARTVPRDDGGPGPP